MSNRKTWTMLNGSKIRIIDMEDSHVLNCIAHLERRYKVLVDDVKFTASSFYDIGPDVLDTNLAALNYSVADVFPIYDDFKNEAKRRGLI